MSRTSTGAPLASATTPFTVAAAMTPVLAELQSCPHRPVVRPDLGEHLVVQHDDAAAATAAVPHEDVVDLTVRAAGRPRPTPHRARPPGEERADSGTPEVSVAG